MYFHGPFSMAEVFSRGYLVKYTAKVDQHCTEYVGCFDVALTPKGLNYQLSNPPIFEVTQTQTALSATGQDLGLTIGVAIFLSVQS